MTKRKTVAIIPYIKTIKGKLSFLVQVRDGNTTHWPNAYWSFGGGLEGDESHDEAAEREFNEEIVIAKVANGKITDTYQLPGEIVPVIQKNGNFVEIVSDVSIKRMYCLNGEQIKHVNDGSGLVEQVKEYLNQGYMTDVQIADGEYFVALEGKGSKWLTEEEIIEGDELLPHTFQNDLLLLANIIKNDF